MDEFLEQSEFWDQRADAWARHADAMESFGSQFGDPAIELLGPAPGEHIADIGCGPGITTIELGRRVGPAGSAVGVDVSAAMVQTAEARAASADVGNVRFEVTDPGHGPFGSFDAVYSRFGIMFFDEPATAFRNVQRSIRPGGRFIAVVWAELDANPWMFLPTMFAAGPLHADLSLPAAGEPGPFLLAEPDTSRALFETAGFRDVDVVRLEHEWRVGSATSADDIGQMLSVGALGAAWEAADGDARTAAVDAVRGACDDYRNDLGWALPATALVYSMSVDA